MATAVKEKPKKPPQVKELRQRAKEITEKISSYGVPAHPYGRGPDGKFIFTIGIHEDLELVLWPGEAEIEVVGSKRHKQVVLTVKETRREVVHEVKTSARYFFDEKEAKNWKVDDNVRRQLQDAFPVRFPGRAKVRWQYDDVKVVKSSDNYFVMAGKVTAFVSATRQSLLAGYDETGLFVCLLPRIVSSVDEAHEALRPDGIDENAVRQGEWFFQPVTRATSRRIETFLRENPAALTMRWLGDDRNREIGAITTHKACGVVYHGAFYVIGYVVDSRAGKVHHEPLWFDDWHQVFRNREVPVAQAQGRRRSWD